MNRDAALANLAIVLVRPKNPENIGSAARIALNMGIKRLLLVGERLPDRELMAKTATHNAAHLLDHIQLYQRLDEALADFSVIVGTTARHGRLRMVETNPRHLADTLAPLLKTNRAAILFGPEDTGLTNEDLKFCHMVSAIPTADFSSLNLAQAVAIHCYEMYYGLCHAKLDAGTYPQLANSHELESMHLYVEGALRSVDFINDKNRTYWMTNIRRFFGRKRLSSKDANIVRTICKKILLHHKGDNSIDPGDP